MEPSFNIRDDLLKSDYFKERVRDYDYAQALYAGLCNNEWIHKDTMSLLKDEGILMSWRTISKLVVTMREGDASNDYMEFYCSGSSRACYAEGTISKEIRRDLNELGWVPKR